MPAIIKLIVLTFVSTIPLLAICSAFEELKTQFDEIDFYQRCNWYKFSAKIQRIMPIIVGNTRETAPFEVFGSVTCSCETYKKVYFNKRA